MNSDTSTESLPALSLVRFPGESGPVLRCRGALTVSTAEPLRRELLLLAPLGHRGITVDISRCSQLDVYGVLTLFELFEQLRRTGSCLALVVGGGAATRILEGLGIAGIVPLFQTEEAAAAALRRDGQSPPAPETWEEAREHTLARWWAIAAALDHFAPSAALRLLTSMFGICARSEEEFRRPQAGTRYPRASSRCHCCPLFEQLGGSAMDVGCRSLLNPILDAINAGDYDLARSQVQEAIRTVSEMPLPREVVGSGQEAVGRRQRRVSRPRSVRRHTAV